MPNSGCCFTSKYIRIIGLIQTKPCLNTPLHYACRVTPKGSSRTATQWIHLLVEPGAALEWLPEPMIPVQGAWFGQTITLPVVPGGRLIHGDMLTPDRVALGKSLAYTRSQAVTLGTLLIATAARLRRSATRCVPGKPMVTLARSARV